MTKLSRRGEVVIPREIWERLGLEKGTGLLVFRVGNRIILKSTSKSPRES